MHAAEQRQQPQNGAVLPCQAAALLFLSSDAYADASAAADLLIELVGRCHGAVAPSGAAEVADALVATLASELSSSNAGVRDAARRAVAKLAELKKGSVAALLAPLRAEYLAPLLAKRLRSLPLLTQVAYVEAISFCIK